MVDRLVFCAVREGARALFARFEDTAGLREYMEHPAHLAVVEKLDAATTGRIRSRLRVLSACRAKKT